MNLECAVPSGSCSSTRAIACAPRRMQQTVSRRSGAWHPHLVFLDVKMAGMDGLEALKRIREADRSVAVVMISGHATIQTAVEATQLGAYDILEKPLDTDRILVTLRNALQHLELYEENSRLRETIESRYEIVGKSYVIRALIDKIDKVAGTPARVLDQR